MWLQWFNLNVMKKILFVRQKNKITTLWQMGDFKTLLHEVSKLYESFVSNQWFERVSNCQRNFETHNEALFTEITWLWHSESLIQNKRFVKLHEAVFWNCPSLDIVIKSLFYFLAHKKYSRLLITLRLNHCSHINCFKHVFSSFLGIESVNYLAGNVGLTEPSDFIKIS